MSQLYCVTCDATTEHAANRNAKKEHCVPCSDQKAALAQLHRMNALRAPRTRSKYGSIPKRAIDGKLKHSKKEADHGNTLILDYRAGKITKLMPDPDDPQSKQVKRALRVYGTPDVESLLEFIEDVEKRGIPGGITRELRARVHRVRQSLYKVCTYSSDYEYTDEHGRERIIDVKGFRTAVYSLKKKLFEVATGLEIEEV